QKGYIPPPLEGIWARYPYLHNGSIPNLCAFMTSPNARPKKYYGGRASDRTRDFSQDCVGYRIGDAASGLTAKEWQEEQYLFDTARLGLSNSGHWDGIFSDENGEFFTPDQKGDLIEFLKTL